MGVGVAIGGEVSISGAGAIDALEGTAVTFGGSYSGGTPISIGGDVNFPNELENTSISFSVCGSLGTPFEIHEFITETFVDEVIAFGGTIHMEY